MRVLVAGWVGSTNLGDELVHAGVRRLLHRAGADHVAVVSVDPAATRAAHGGEVVSSRDLAGLVRAVRAADLVVLGGGGLVQDSTSPFNLPYHLSRPWLATRADRPWVGVALGAGPVTGALGRRLARFLRTARAISVRDDASAEALAELGVGPVTVAADAAFALPAIDSPPEDVVTVSLRPWGGPGGGRLPVGLRGDPTPRWFAPAAAEALDEIARRTGLGIELVALQTDRDHRLHLQVQGLMRAPATCAQPPLADVAAQVARGRVVVAMRYHAGIAATLAGRPVAGVRYSPKVAALAGELGAGAALTDWSPDGIATLPDRVDAIAGATAPVLAARTRLRDRAERSVEVIRAGLGA